MTDLFSQFDEEPAKRTKVPNLFPTIQAPYRLAIIGEAPGKDEVAQGKPFVGMSGQMLDNILSKLGILRSACFIGNVCQIQPPGNDISKFEEGGPEIQEGLTQLREDLARVRPNLCLLLGKTALWAANGSRSLGDWRGTVFPSSSLMVGQEVKCLASYHPAYCLRQYEWTPILTFDTAKAARHAHSPSLSYPQRNLVIDLTHSNLLHSIKKLVGSKRGVAADIEGGVSNVSCISLATDDSNSF